MLPPAVLSRLLLLPTGTVPFDGDGRTLWPPWFGNLPKPGHQELAASTSSILNAVATSLPIQHIATPRRLSGPSAYVQLCKSAALQGTLHVRSRELTPTGRERKIQCDKWAKTKASPSLPKTPTQNMPSLYRSYLDGFVRASVNADSAEAAHRDRDLGNSIHVVIDTGSGAAQECLVTRCLLRNIVHRQLANTSVEWHGPTFVGLRQVPAADAFHNQPGPGEGSNGDSMAQCVIASTQAKGRSLGKYLALLDGDHAHCLVINMVHKLAAMLRAGQERMPFFMHGDMGGLSHLLCELEPAAYLNVQGNASTRRIVSSAASNLSVGECSLIDFELATVSAPIDDSRLAVFGPTFAFITNKTNSRNAAWHRADLKKFFYFFARKVIRSISLSDASSAKSEMKRLLLGWLSGFFSTECNYAEKEMPGYNRVTEEKERKIMYSDLRECFSPARVMEYIHRNPGEACRSLGE